jgi:polyhydroxybutyrate depolymerase
MSDAELRPGDQELTLDQAGVERRVLVHRPAQCPSPAPLVLAFHGGGTHAGTMPDFSGLSDTADRHGFIVAYPYGSGRASQFLTWNAGRCCGHAAKHQVDDVGFAAAIIARAVARWDVDRRHVYATGMSNGAMLSYRIAAERADLVAAIAPVGGAMVLDQCRPSRPVPIQHWHGTADEYAPYYGGRGVKSLTGVNFPSVDQTIAQWVRANRCQEPPHREPLPDYDDGPMRVVRTTWSPRDGDTGAEIELFTIERGGHTWPGRKPAWEMLGPWIATIDASERIWRFFARHRLPE